MQPTIAAPARALYDAYSRDSLFLVWGPPHLGPRSSVLARELGMDVAFIYSTTRRGLLVAPVKYGYQAIRTLALLFTRRPQIVFVQSPPSFAVLFVFLYCLLTGSRYIVDAHSAAFQMPFWTKPAWLYRLLARRAVATLVTNEHFAERLEGWGARAFILRDIPTEFPREGSYPFQNGAFNVAVVNTFAPDEPLAAVLEAAAHLPDVDFYITGKTSRAPAGLLDRAPGNVHFTGFLPDATYYALLASSHAVMCLTTRDNTMQRGACEALSLGRPIVTSDWPLLRAYFNQGAVHVPNTSGGVREGLRALRRDYAAFEAGVRALQQAQRQEWNQKVRELVRLIEQAARPAKERNRGPR